ncbi:MAG: hypothetical protein UW90_C0004G0058 [Candidatus Yanofskybacteria bacterium GW2011_GWB1_45_11]|uniref:VWFA domain-containing protein n=1 Tax=Candidatus Yanofskybacteria bacterium GW2011_GWB1_45_11 TaxID=1619026 RepID=A0A0G1L3D2_9BACT|nr:MAG: hypothetical protein UW90_C0004G0058 [Candidatus Yanofskybacteria bacterium GW2011_GWB1_45_11]
MANVIPLHNMRETGDDLFESSTPDEEAARILERELPHLCNDMGMLISRPFRLVWVPSVQTASTDCIAEVRIAPQPFLEGRRDIGYGTAYHETGHIRYSGYGQWLLRRADEEGGQVLRDLTNIILDRKDDMLLADDAPGFAETLRKRLLYICTMGQRKRYARFKGNMSEENFEGFLRHIRPRDPYEDFFLAAKWHRTPRFKSTARAMRYVRQNRLRKASPQELLWIAKRVQEILGDLPEKEKEDAEQKFTRLYGLMAGIECNVPGHSLDPKLDRALKKVMARYVASLRQGGLRQLLNQLKAVGVVWPGPLSVGLEDRVPVRKVLPDADCRGLYQQFLGPLQQYVDGLKKRLKQLGNPSEFELYGRDEGDLDLSESARIATGLSGYYMETVVERDIDAEIHLAIDASGSMANKKIAIAKGIATVFSEAILAIHPACEGRIWSFNSDEICDYGPVSQSSAFVRAEGHNGNSDTHMLNVVGKELAHSRKRRKVLIVLCDDGPDDIEMVKRLSRQLVARGIIVVHLLVGVHGTPDIYPVELLYTSMQECLDEFADLLMTIVGHLK